MCIRDRGWVSAGRAAKAIADAGADRALRGAFDINGRHAVEATLNVLVNASIIRDKPTTAKVYLLADLTTTGVTGNVVGKLCKLEIPPVPLEGQAPLIFTPGPGLIESVKTVSAAGMLGGNTTCSTFKSDVLTVILGADVMPITGLLPQTTTTGAPAPYCAGDLKTDCDPDPTGTNCACDQEKDDKPGSTLIAMNVPGLTDLKEIYAALRTCLLYTSPSPRDRTRSRMPSSA